MGISISTVEDSDIHKILEIQTKCNLSEWTAEDYQKEITRDDSIILAAKIGGETVGFLTARFAMVNQLAGDQVEYREQVEYAELDILNFGVFREFQKQGVGNLLFEHLLNTLTAVRLETIWLEVRESNLDAISFYKKRGFTAIQTRKNFYRQPLENALVMKLEQRTATRKFFNKT